MDGYDYEPVDNSPYLRLKKKGDKARIRIASKPIHYTKTVKDDKGREKEVERFAWLVIDKTKATEPKAKGFEAGPMIYRFIKDYALNEEWGDPTTYDLTITRTEEKGSYYTVISSPGKSDITAEEQELIKATALDLNSLFQIEDGKSTSTFGSDDSKQEEGPEEGSSQGSDDSDGTEPIDLSAEPDDENKAQKLDRPLTSTEQINLDV